MQNGGIAEDCSVLVVGDIYDTYNPSAVAEELFYDVIDRLNDIVGGKMILQSHGKEIFHCPISRFFLPQ